MTLINRCLVIGTFVNSNIDIQFNRKKYVGLLLILLTMVGSWVITGTLASYYEFPMNMFGYVFTLV